MSDGNITEASGQALAEMEVSSEKAEATTVGVQLGDANAIRDSSEATTEAQASDHVPDVYEIVPDGDLILLVGRRRTKIQLTRHLLCKASPVLLDLLAGSNIIGSGAPRQDTPYVFELPDDDPVAFRIAFDILYVPSFTTHSLIPEEVHAVIALAAKYEMTESFVYAAAYWFRHSSPNTLDSMYGPGECWHLMMAAYWMRSSTDFFDFSARLVAETSDPLVQYVSRKEHTLLELRICCKKISIPTDASCLTWPDIQWRSMNAGVPLNVRDGTIAKFIWASI
ncbi:hypothetical protein NW762_008461 [Fusarium torreyae]|uniref:BTB domain-containing protein n=1 Tax=Fusarium torreyae TaxID=1237075 RepID=A0A9W8RWI8_9HYPO|nr:hypothetical protein NW762_008461 [Fusarium torreyae]